VAFDNLTILVIHYRTPKLLSSCLEKLTACAPGARVIVVDSSPPEETPALNVETLNVSNHSFAHAVNCGLKLVGTPYVAHMNADVFVSEETFLALLKAVQQSGVGMVGPRARTQDGRLQQQGLPYRRHYAWLERSRQNSVPVPWLSGCLQLLRADAVTAVGGMDASLRFYNEDMEWCFRLRRAGWACHLVKTDVLHLGGSSTPKDPHFIVEGYRGGYKLSQRYHGALYQQLHRAAVRFVSGWDVRFGRNPVRRQAAAQIGEMFRRGNFDESPFGKTLLDEG
jgi:N-acetylglucosaminyl-diphospho-decaprenol L-rhamnosyltransferase